MSEKKCFFITGTDTGVGKTWAAVTLMRYFNKQGFAVAGMKPVAAGCHWHNDQLKNEDALLLQENASHRLPYEIINPYAFEMPISPHLSTQENSVQMDIVLQAFTQLKAKADVVIVEGAGGWLTPISQQYDIATLAKALKIPVIMVVAIRLGCINQARLTYQAISSDKIPCVGWLAVCVEPDMAYQKENIATIKNKIKTPLLGTLPYSVTRDFNRLAGHIKL